MLAELEIQEIVTADQLQRGSWVIGRQGILYLTYVGGDNRNLVFETYTTEGKRLSIRGGALSFHLENPNQISVISQPFPRRA